MSGTINTPSIYSQTCYIRQITTGKQDIYAYTYTLYSDCLLHYSVSQGDKLT